MDKLSSEGDLEALAIASREQLVIALQRERVGSHEVGPIFNRLLAESHRVISVSCLLWSIAATKTSLACGTKFSILRQHSRRPKGGRKKLSPIISFWKRT